MSNYHSPNKSTYLILISLLTLIAFFTLFIFRAVDDNRLISWQWAFPGIDVTRILFFLIIGMIFSYAFSKVSFPGRNPAIFLFLSSFVISLFFWKEPEVIVDASRYFTQAKHIKVYGIRYFVSEWGKDIYAWTDPPLIPFLYGLIFKFLGGSRTYIQLFTTSLFAMTVVLTYLIGKTLWDKDTGFFAGVLLLGIPYLFTQVPLMLVDVPTMFFLTLLIFIFIKAIERGRVYIVLSSVTIFFTLFSKYSTWLMVSVLVIISLVYLKNPNGRRGRRLTVLQRTSAIAFISGLLVLALILVKFDVVSEQIKLLMDYQRPGLRRWGESFISTFFYQTHPFLTIASLYSIYIAFRKRDLRLVIVSWLVVLVVLLQIKRIRYIMIVFPMFALMASYGMQAIKDREIRKFLVSCAVISSIVVAVFVYLPFLKRMSPVNLKDAGRFLDSIDAAHIEVLTAPSTNYVINPAVSVPILDFFTKKDIYYNYDINPPPLEMIKESSLRFTWGYKNPGYYSASSERTSDNTVIVVISSELGQKFQPDYIAQKIEGFQLAKRFKASVQVFKYVTIVEIYKQER